MYALFRCFLLSISFLFFTSSVLLGSEGGVSPYAYHLFDVVGIGITNAMVMSWVISVLLIALVRWMVGSPQLIPTRSQALIEVLVEKVKAIVSPIVGDRMVAPTFPFLISLFFFILIHNWSSLLPGVGTIGYYEGHHLVYFLRPGNADLNGTLALSCIAMLAWFYFVLRYAGIKVLLFDLFGNKADRKEVNFFVYAFLFFIFLGVGVIEVISILFRPISLSLRLYGNVFGGENLLNSVSGILSWVLPVPFYFLEVLIGLVQALVFTLLVSVYIGAICNHSDEHAHS
jgi:F-type H+-transporting ATPase subunit a